MSAIRYGSGRGYAPGNNYLLGTDVLGASFEVKLPLGVTAKADGIPTWAAIVLGAAAALGVVWFARR